MNRKAQAKACGYLLCEKKKRRTRRSASLHNKKQLDPPNKSEDDRAGHIQSAIYDYYSYMLFYIHFFGNCNSGAGLAEDNLEFTVFIQT